MPDIDDGADPDNQPIDPKKYDAARAVATERYALGSDDDVEIEDDAEVVLSGNEEGFWVQAWVYVPMDDVETQA